MSASRATRPLIFSLGSMAKLIGYAFALGKGVSAGAQHGNTGLAVEQPVEETGELAGVERQCHRLHRGRPRPATSTATGSQGRPASWRRADCRRSRRKASPASPSPAARTIPRSARRNGFDSGSKRPATSVLPRSVAVMNWKRSLETDRDEIGDACQFVELPEQRRHLDHGADQHARRRRMPVATHVS